MLGQLGHFRVVGWPTGGSLVGPLGAHVDNQEQTHNAQHPYICHAVSGDREYFRHIVLKKNYTCCTTTFLEVSEESTLEQKTMMPTESCTLTVTCTMYMPYIYGGIGEGRQFLTYDAEGTGGKQQFMFGFN